MPKGLINCFESTTYNFRFPGIHGALSEIMDLDTLDNERFKRKINNRKINV